MKNLIFLRHGETTKDKNNSLRGLSKRGRQQVAASAQDFSKYITGTLAILHTPTVRARQTAKIIPKIIGKGELYEEPLRIIGIDNIHDLIKENESKGIRPAETYLNLKSYKAKKVESPEELYIRLNNIIKSYKEECIVVVSHEASLDGFLSQVQPICIMQKSFKYYFGYSDWVMINL